MNHSSTYFRTALVVLLITGLQACIRQKEELPTPTAAGVSIAEAQTWFYATHQKTVPTTSITDMAPISTAKLVWARAITMGQGAQQLVLVPLAGDAALFVGKPWQGTRYLVVARSSGAALNGNVVELLLKRSTTGSIDTTALFAGLYRSFRSNHLSAPIGAEGYVLLYSADYTYMTGYGFRQGSLRSGIARLYFAPRSSFSKSKHQALSSVGSPTSNSQPVDSGPCTDSYVLINGDWVYNNTFGDCSNGGGVPIGYHGEGASGDGPYGYGGHDSGGAGNQGSGSTSGGLPITYPATIIIGNLSSCVLPILSALQNLNGNDIGGVFQFFNTTPHTDWVIQAGYIPLNSQGKVNALTSQSDGMPADYLTTTLNESFIATATDVAISRTIIHEAMHAYLMRWGYAQGMGVNATTSQLVDGYLGTTNPNNPAGQHDAMANIINQMAGALQAAFPNLQMSNMYAQNLFWAGLSKTQAYALLPAAQKAAIVAAARAEANSEAAAIGTKACN